MTPLCSLQAHLRGRSVWKVVYWYPGWRRLPDSPGSVCPGTAQAGVWVLEEHRFHWWLYGVTGSQRTDHCKVVTNGVYHLLRCEVLLWFYHALYLRKHVGMFHFCKSFIPTLPLATKALKLHWEVKIKVVSLLSLWGLTGAPWWENSKSGLRIELWWHLPLFWP